MEAEKINPEQIARAAAQGVAIALTARRISGDLDDVLRIGPIVIGGWPADLFEVTLERDTSSGEVAVKSVQPQKYTGTS